MKTFRLMYSGGVAVDIVAPSSFGAVAQAKDIPQVSGLQLEKITKLSDEDILND